MVSDLMSDAVPAVCGCAALYTLQREFALFRPFSIGLRTNKKIALGGGGWGGLSPWLDLQKPIQGSGVRMQ